MSCRVMRDLGSGPSPGRSWAHPGAVLPGGRAQGARPVPRCPWDRGSSSSPAAATHTGRPGCRGLWAARGLARPPPLSADSSQASPKPRGPTGSSWTPPHVLWLKSRGKLCRISADSAQDAWGVGSPAESARMAVGSCPPRAGWMWSGGSPASSPSASQALRCL